MTDIEKIWDMIDWYQPASIQAEGRELARNIETCIPFLQPLTPKYNKNIWENCALILAEKSDEELAPHLVSLLEWLQDMNWPGASCIFNRLKKYREYNTLNNAISSCVEDAKSRNDKAWECNLSMLGGHGTA